MLSRRIAGSLLVVASLVACGRQDAAPEVGRSVAPAESPPDWVRELGPVLVIPGDSTRAALIVSPQSADTPPPSIRLLSPNWSFTPPLQTIAQESDSLGCDAPTMQVRGRVPAEWTFGVADTALLAVRLESLDSLPGADSSAFAADVARVASALAPSDSRLRGLPFVVLKAHRFTRGDRTTLFATALRRLPQEATPIEARSFVVAERVGSGQYVLSYGLRSEGTEDSAEHFDLLGVIRSGQQDFALLSVEQESGTRYEILERTPTGDWRVRWSRALSC